jgi:hypothetical protein
VCKDTADALLELLRDERPTLAIQFAAVMDIGPTLKSANAFLEGDGFLAPWTYACLDKLLRFCVEFESKALYPNLRSVATMLAREQSGGLADVEVDLVMVFVNRGLDAVRPCLTYIRDKYNHELSHDLAIWKACRLLHPVIFRAEVTAGADVSIFKELLILKGITEAMLPDQKEFEDYKVAADDFDLTQTDILQFFCRFRSGQLSKYIIPTVAAYQPSEASCERVFSVYQCLFNDQQRAALEDYVETAMMLNYNYRNGMLLGVGAVVKTPKMQSILDGVGLPSETGEVFARRVSALRRGSIASYFAPPVVVNVPPVDVAPVELPPVEVAPVELPPVEVPPVELPPVDIAPVDEAEPKWTVKREPADDSCLFHCFADSLTGNTMVAQDLREVTAQKFINNEGDIRSFLEDGQTWEAYVAKVRNPRFWGGSQEITTVWRHFNSNQDPLMILVLDGDSGLWTTWGPIHSTRAIVLLRVKSSHFDLLCCGSDSLIKRAVTDRDKLEIEDVSRTYLARCAEALKNMPNDPASMELMANQGYLADRALQCMRLQEYKEAMMRRVDIDDQPIESKSVESSAKPSANDRPSGTAHLPLQS